MNYVMAIAGGIFALIILYDVFTHGQLVTDLLTLASNDLTGETKLLEAR